MIGNMLLIIGTLQGASATEIPIDSDGHASNPVWSPDGTKLAFEVNEYAGKIELYAVEMEATQIKKLPLQIKVSSGNSQFGGSSSTVNAAPVWHKRGMLIFESSHKGVNTRLFQQSFKGSPPSPIIGIDKLSGDLSWPTLSEDGSTMLFISDSTGKGDIYSYTFQGREVSPLVTSDYSEMAPRVDPNGTLVYTRKRGNGEDIFIQKEGTSKDWIGGSGDQTRPIWAGKNVVFFSSERGVDIWDVVVSSEPRKKKVVAKDVRLPMRAPPAISPDQQWVAYGVEDPSKSNSIWFSKLDGTKTFGLSTKHVACGEPSLTEYNNRILLAYTALPSKGSAWRQLHVVDVTDKLK